MPPAISAQMQTALKGLRAKLKDAEKAVTSSDAKILGAQVVTEMTKMISKGISPVGGKRYEAYKRAGDKRGYPANARSEFPDKRNRPVNLRLSGEFLQDLTHKVDRNGRGYAPRIGYFEEESKLKEQGHAEGVGGQPKRPTIPESFDGWAVSIQRIILRFYKNLYDKHFKP